MDRFGQVRTILNLDRFGQVRSEPGPNLTEPDRTVEVRRGTVSTLLQNSKNSGHDTPSTSPEGQRLETDPGVTY